MIARRGAAFGVGVALATSATMFAGACSSSTNETGAFVLDASNESPAAGDGGDPIPDATNESPADAPSSTCVGACKLTSLVTDFGGKARTLNRAQFGTQRSDAGVAQLHTESHLGGSPACPTMTSPSPDYTLIVSAIPRGSTGRKLTGNNDGLTSAFFDFKGDLGLPPFTKAISVNVTVVGEDPATPPTWIALDVSNYFTEGTVKGHLYAEYCASLSQ